MSTTEQSQRISEALGKAWPNADNVARARLVIAWCGENGIDTFSLTEGMGAKALAAAMSVQKYWAQGPSDYLDMVESIRKFLNTR